MILSQCIYIKTCASDLQFVMYSFVIIYSCRENTYGLWLRQEIEVGHPGERKGFGGEPGGRLARKM